VNLDIRNLSKQYSGNVWGLRDFSLQAQSGIIGLLGPNGAGKSTLMRILATITRPTFGTFSWNGLDALTNPRALRAELGYLPQEFGVYPNLNAGEFLNYMAALKGLGTSVSRKRIDELLVTVNLLDARKRPLGGYSGGMKQRIGIAQALLNDPRLLIVDEPTVGLDPEERVRFRNLLTDLSGDRLVILSTHIVSDVEAAANKIALMAQGRLLAFATPEDLLATVRGKVWSWTITSEALTKARESFLVSSMTRTSNGLAVRIVSSTKPAPDATPAEPCLEDAYLFAISANRSISL
jgi:ABC-type multidrug transport system ATPase subunit